MASEAELRDLIEQIKAPSPDKGILSNNVLSCLGLSNRLSACLPLRRLGDAVLLAETAFPGEYWELRNHDSHPHFENWQYNASLGGKQCEAVRMGADRPEKALTLAVLYLKLQLLPQ